MLATFRYILFRLFNVKQPEPMERILVDREGVAYLPQGRRVILKANA